MPDVKDVKVFKPDPQQTQQASTWPIWGCEKSVFDWEYTQTEKCLILQGSVTVKDPDGSNKVDFAAGDMVIFPNGLSCIWEVKEPVKKHYTFE